MRTSQRLFIFLASSFAAGLCQASPDAEPNQYWNSKIPVIEGASEVESLDITELATKSTSFSIQVDSVESVFEFYDEFFTANGWTDPYQVPASMRNQIGGNWSGFNFTFGIDGNPRGAFARTWKAADIPVMANVTFEATEYDGNQFSGTVTVTMSPEVSLAPLMSLQSELSKRPEALFILSEQVGGNPFDLTDANIAARPDMDDADPIVVSYFEAIDKILEGYEEFRNKHRIDQ